MKATPNPPSPPAFPPSLRAQRHRRAAPSRRVALAGRTVEVVDFASVTNRFSHDALGRRVAATDGRGNATVYAYDPFGRILSTTDPAGFTTSFAYDEAGRRVSATDPLGNTVHTDYDAAGRVVAESGAKIEKEKQMPNGIIHMENAFWIFGETFNGYCD